MNPGTVSIINSSIVEILKTFILAEPNLPRDSQIFRWSSGRTQSLMVRPQGNWGTLPMEHQIQ